MHKKTTPQAHPSPSWPGLRACCGMFRDTTYDASGPVPLVRGPMSAFTPLVDVPATVPRCSSQTVLRSTQGRAQWRWSTRLPAARQVQRNRG